jgi:hypothetical protein
MSSDPDGVTGGDAERTKSAPTAADEEAVAESFPVDDAGLAESAGADDTGDGTGAPAIGDIGKRVVLEHGFFRCFEEPYFRLSDLRGGQPVFVCRIGADEMVLPFKGIAQECDIADASSDGRMLMAIGRALQFVKAIRPGDPLPPELFDSGVSWQVEPHHTALAHKRLASQLLEWMFDGDAGVSAAELADRMETDRDAQAKLSAAFGEAAKQLGFGDGGREKVAGMIEALVADLAYIEALREKYLALERIQRSLAAIQSRYRKELSVYNLARTVAQLHAKAMREFGRIFAEVDAQTGEVVSALKNLGAQQRFIRTSRNRLHTRLMPWDDIIEQWDRVNVRRGDVVMSLLRDLYRFLAPRYMAIDEWVVQSAPSNHVGGAGLLGSADDDDFAPPVRAMDWF